MSVSTLERPRGASASRPNGNGQRARFAVPEHHELTLERMDVPGESSRDIPTRVTLICPDPHRPAADLLFLDQVPVPREAWNYDAHDRVLTWQGAYGGGHLSLGHDDQGGYGGIGPALNHVGVTASATAHFTCDVAPHCGATYESSGGTIVGLHWDPGSQAWKDAAWQANRMRVSYTVTPGSQLEPPSFTFQFEDLATGAIPWDPSAGSFHASLVPAVRDDQMVWQLAFASSVDPDPDTGLPPSGGPDSVYPYRMQAVEDAAAAHIDGVLQVGGFAPKGTLVGLRGVRSAPSIAGYYRAGRKSAPFGIFGGCMTLDGAAVPGSRVIADRLSWTDLPPDVQERTGLPAEGDLRFTVDGSRAADDDAGLRVVRLAANPAHAAIAAHGDLHEQVHAQATAFAAAVDASTLTIQGLLPMTPYTKADGAWGDAVQAAVTDDLGAIMNSFMPSALWNLVFPNTPQPTLSGKLADVANSPVTGVEDPPAFYRSLATAVMVRGMAEGSDPACRQLNGPRAAAWLKTELARSPVYAAHGATLFAHEWQQRWPATADYLADQATDTAEQRTTITDKRDAAVAEIDANVAVDPTAKTDVRAQLKGDVRNAAQYALDNKLYWAFAYYTYNVAPAILANIQLAISMNTGSSDGTALSRMFQQNVAVLTALDPSGYFAERYTTTMNTFLATNILPSMFGFREDGTSFGLLKEYLQTFVANNLDNENQKIAAAAAQIQAILQTENADALLHDSIDALRSISELVADAMALPVVAQRWVAWLEGRPWVRGAATVFGSLVITGLSCIAMFNLIGEFKDYAKLTAKERATLILDTVQLGLQVVAAVVQRGVRVYAIFKVDGMTITQRSAAVSRILATGEAAGLDAGLARIGNAAARWLGDTQGAAAARVAARGAAAVLIAEEVANAEQVGLLVKVLGRNLEEFMATRLGPLLIIAGIVMSAISIGSGDRGAALAADILNIVSGSLMLIAIAGEWALAAGVGAAAGTLSVIVSIAGPLAILCALAGVGLMLYETFKKRPNPVEDFVDQYAKPAGFAIAARPFSIDYATDYVDKDDADLLKVGFTLSAGARALSAGPDGTITLGSATALPDCVWRASTDGRGMSRITTMLQPDPARPPVPRLLSLMSDGSVRFAPAAGSTGAAAGTEPTVVTQTWATSVLSGPPQTATTDRHLKTVGLSLSAMRAPADGTRPPSPADCAGVLVRQGDRLGVTPSASTSNPDAVFHLAMSGMGPNAMRMSDLHFPLGTTPSRRQTFGPVFGVLPSTPVTWTLPEGTLPSFLTFDPKLGTISPNGGTADTAGVVSATVEAGNRLGRATASFTITVAAAAGR